MRWKVFCFTAISVFLAACGVTIVESNTEINFKPNEKWGVVYEFTIPNEEYLIMGSMVNESLTEIVSDYSSDGLEASWERSIVNGEGNVPIVLNVSGQGYEILTDSLFEKTSIVTLDSESKTIYQFSMTSYGGISEEAQESVVTLNAGDIITTNGIKVDRNTVEWQNWSGDMKAEFYEPTNLYSNPYFLITIGVLLISFAYLMKSRKFGKVRNPMKASNQILSNARYCRCGTRIGEEVVFCPNCGEKKI